MIYVKGMTDIVLLTYLSSEKFIYMPVRALT